jgi:hypothetical protein
MDTIYRGWAVWYVSSQNELLYVEYVGTLENCVRFVEPRQCGVYAILPYEKTDEQA